MSLGLRMIFVFDICQNGTQNTFFVCRRSLARSTTLAKTATSGAFS